MRLAWLAVVALPVSLAACGGSPEAGTVAVNCGAGGTSLAGARSIDVTPGANGTVLTFPDPANAGHTGTIAIAPGGRCTIRTTQPVVE